MKRLTAVLAAASALIAVQAHAASYDFSFSDTTLLTLGTSSAVAAPDAVASPVYTFTLDTSTATANRTVGSAIFSNVNIYNSGTLLGTDTIQFSTNVGGVAAQTSGLSDTSAPAAGSRVLNATGAYAFEFDPAVFATGGGNTITFTPGAYAGEDTVHGSVNATILVSPSAVSAAPEPGAWALMLGGVGAMGLMLRRRRSAALTA